MRKRRSLAENMKRETNLMIDNAKINLETSIDKFVTKWLLNKLFLIKEYTSYTSCIYFIQCLFYQVVYELNQGFFSFDKTENLVNVNYEKN